MMAGMAQLSCGPTVQCTMYVVLYNVCMWSYSTVYNVCGPTVQCTMYMVLQYSVQCMWSYSTVYNVCGPTVQCTMYVVLQYSVQCMWSFSLAIRILLLIFNCMSCVCDILKCFNSMLIDTQSITSTCWSTI